MDSTNKSELLKKYWRGETTSAEEAVLQQFLEKEQQGLTEEERSFFEKVNAFSKLKLDTDFENKLLQNLPDEVQPANQLRKIFSTYRSIAASFLLLMILGAYSYWNTKQQNAIAARLAFDEARQSLLLMSSKLNKGSSVSTYQLSKFSAAQQKIKKE